MSWRVSSRVNTWPVTLARMVASSVSSTRSVTLEQVDDREV